MEKKRNSSSRRGADTVLCRACLADCRPQQTKFLFGKWQSPTKSPVTDASNVTIADMLCEITKTTVKLGDKYPDHICSTCLQNFWTAHTFIHRVCQSDKIMRKNWKYFQANRKKSPPPANENQLDRSITRNASNKAKTEALAKTDSEETKNDTEKTKNKSEKIKTKISMSDHLTQLVKKSPVVVLEKLMLGEPKNDWEIKEEIDIKNEVLSDTENDSSFQNLNQSNVSATSNDLGSIDRDTEIKIEQPEEITQEEKDVLKEYPRIVATQGADEKQTKDSKKQLNTYEKKHSANKKQLRSAQKLLSADKKSRVTDGELLASDDHPDTDTLLVKTGEVPAQLREGGEWTDMNEMYVKEELDEELDEEDVDIDLMCILCSKSFITIGGLKAHVISTHSYKWAIRVDALSQQLSSKTRISEADEFHCKICVKVYQTTDQLKEHMEGHIKRAREMAAEKKGRSGQARASKSTAGGNYPCVGCNVPQATYKLLLLHANTCHKRLQLLGHTQQTTSPPHFTSCLKENSEESTEEDTQKNNKNSYKCKKCNQVFDGSLYLKIHNEIHHTALNGDITTTNTQQSMEE